MLNLQDVKTLLHEEEDTLSLYLNVDNAVPENQAASPAWGIALKNALRDIEAELEDHQKAGWKAVQERTEAFFHSYRPRSKGLVMFVTAEDEQVYELPIPTENEAKFGRPLVVPLVWKLDEYEPYLVVMTDQEEAHFYISYLGETEFEEGLEIDLEEYDFGQKTLMPATPAVVGGRPLTQGSHRDEFEDTIDEHRTRFYRDVVEATRRMTEETSAKRIILGGSEQSAHAVHNLMDDKLQAQVVSVMSIPMRYAPHEIFRDIEPVALNYERDQEMDLMQEIIDFAKSGGRGALGAEAVEKAFEMQQVEMLVLSWPLEDTRAANQLTHQALTLNSKIELVHGAAAIKLNEEGQGIAARLYFAV